MLTCGVHAGEPRVGIYWGAVVAVPRAGLAVHPAPRDLYQGRGGQSAAGRMDSTEHAKKRRRHRPSTDGGARDMRDVASQYRNLIVSKTILAAVLRSLRVPAAVEERPLAFASVRHMLDAIQRDKGRLSHIPACREDEPETGEADAA